MSDTFVQKHLKPQCVVGLVEPDREAVSVWSHGIDNGACQINQPLVSHLLTPAEGGHETGAAPNEDGMRFRSHPLHLPSANSTRPPLCLTELMLKVAFL